MAEQNNTDRWREIREIHKENANFYRMLRGGVIVVLFLFIGWSVFQENDEPRAFGMNLWTEIAGIAVTVLIIDLLNERRDERRYKQQLVDESGSNSNEIAKHAVYIMYRRQWRKGEKSILRGADLRYAQLQGADLSSANVSKANFERANLQSTIFTLAMALNTKFPEARLQKAVMKYANLEGAIFFAALMAEADLEQTNLRNASFDYADLPSADLRGARLQGATFKYTDLAGTDFGGANLERAVFERVKFDRNTILPDNSNWFPEVDMNRFTDPMHPDFWTSKRVKKPYDYHHSRRDVADD